MRKNICDGGEIVTNCKSTPSTFTLPSANARVWS
jgi:hypothetical protein